MGVEEILALAITQSAGERHATRFTPTVVVEVQFEAGPDGSDADTVRFAAAVSVKDRETGTLQYSGSSTCQVRFASGVEVAPPDVFPVVWPHLRADLAAQCARIAQQQLSLPWELSAEVLEPADSPAQN